MSKKPETNLEKLAMRMTEWIGSVPSLIFHTIAFIVIFGLLFFGVTLSAVLLILTTAVSLEAIYMAIFIQMTVNRNTESLEEVEKDIDEIQVDVDEIQEDVDELEKEVDEIHDDVAEDNIGEESRAATLDKIEKGLGEIIREIELLKKK